MQVYNINSGGRYFLNYENCAIVTGAAGFIGYHLCKELINNSFRVVAICRPDSPSISRLQEFRDDSIIIIESELEEINENSDFFKTLNNPIFYHLAWDGIVSSKRNDYVRQSNNFIYSVKCFQLAQLIEAKKFIATGTICENQCDYWTKGDASDSYYYLQTKKITHEYLHLVANQIKMPFVWCQFYHPVGKYNNREQVIASTVDSLLNHKTKSLGDCEGLFNVIDVRDLAYALLLMGKHSLGKNCYYVGGPDVIKLAGYMEKICKYIEKRTGADPHEFINKNTRKNDGRVMNKEWLDYSDFSSETNYMPRYSFDDTLDYLCDWIEDMQ